MLDAIVRYLHSSRVPFRLASYPSDEAEPKVAHPLTGGALLVTSRFLLVDGRLVLACAAASDHLDLRAVAAELGGSAIEAAPEDLPEALMRAQATGEIPPLGQLYGVPLVVDERVAEASTIAFAVFGSDFIEIAYDDFSREEQPLVASMVRAGELGPARRDARPSAP